MHPWIGHSYPKQELFQCCTARPPTDVAAYYFSFQKNLVPIKKKFPDLSSFSPPRTFIFACDKQIMTRWIFSIIVIVLIITITVRENLKGFLWHSFYGLVCSLLQMTPSWAPLTISYAKHFLRWDWNTSAPPPPLHIFSHALQCCLPFLLWCKLGAILLYFVVFSYSYIKI